MSQLEDGECLPMCVVVLPETFTGKEIFGHWIRYFKSVFSHVESW